MQTHLFATYSSAASIDHVRATSFHRHDQEMGIASDNRTLSQNPVHQQYYQSHSYPHDPRHHLLHHPPGNSREARENLPLTNRALPEPRSSTRTSATALSTKRKAAWDDEDGKNVSYAENGGNNTIESDDNLSRTESMGYPTPVSSSNLSTHPFFVVQCSVQDFVKSTAIDTVADQDQQMDSVDVHLSHNGTSTASSRMSMDMLSMDPTGTDTVQSNPSGVDTKRTRPRLDRSVSGTGSAAEARRLQSGEQVQDIFQECFYNAAASLR
jgi:hypothetical protein